ncbi:MAG: hydroxylamine reductase [Bacilli bacterium]|nr:hydroxylamine reductase [Bacilli bacterium]
MIKKMYCYQCQETANNEACEIKGVCGKDNELANLMDIFKYSLKRLAKEAIDNDKRTKEIDLFIMQGLFKLITNANFDKEVFKQVINNSYYLIKQINDLADDYVFNDDSWQTIGTQKEVDLDLRGVKELIITGLMGLAAYHNHAVVLGYEDISIHDFTINTLATIDDIHDLDTLIGLVDQTGAFGVQGMALLDKANTQSFGQPEITNVNIGVNKRPGILISGHDLSDIAQLLEQSKDSGVDIYTHSEMLPAHYYPQLKAYSHLVANYGGAWHTQRKDFSTFNGPILFTTNCIVPPLDDANYKDRLYSTGNAGHPGFKYISYRDGKKDFSSIIAHALQCLPPQEIETGNIVGGFAHNQVSLLIDKVIENIENGSIRKFMVMAGCDGRQLTRSYYAEFAQGLEKDTIILTAGCAKYRYNKLNLGDINGIPRVLDAGQCNDSYSLVLIALKLQEHFNLKDLNDLPIAYNIAWYEQKAVIVLLSLLHLGIKNIKLGPTLPAFITPNVANFLVENYQISTIDNVEDDLKNIG